MKLLVVLDVANYNRIWDEYDLILCEKKTPGVSADKQFTFDTFHPDRNYLLQRYNKQYNEFLKLIPASYFDLFESNSSTVFHEIINDVCLRMFAVSNITSKFNITGITCDRYVHANNYLPFYEAFGETNIKLLFKNSDFLSSLIKDFCYEKGIAFSYLKKGAKFILKLKIFVRRYCLLVIKLLLSLKVYIFSKKFHINQVAPEDGRPEFYISVRSTVHSEFLLPFIKKYAPNCFIIVGERQFAYGANRDFWKRNFNFNVFPERCFFKIKDFFSIFNKILLLIFLDSEKFSRDAKDFQMDFEYFKIKPFDLLPEFCISYYEQYLHYICIKRFLKYINANNGVVISTEQLTTYPYWLSRAASEKNLKSLQVQTTLLNPFEQAEFVRTDKFLFYDEGLLQALSIKNPSSKHKFDYWGFLKINENVLANKVKSLKKVVYFTQPYEFEYEDEIITLLIQMEGKYGYQMFLKVHPRDQHSRFKKFGVNRILENKVSMNEITSQFDLAVTRTSSIGIDCFINNLPVIFCVLSESARKTSATFLDKKYSGYITSIEGVEPILLNYEAFLNYFYSYSEKFKKKNNLTFDKKLFDEKLKMFMLS
jgi:hypothetical protein